jgi:hypothetical protein
MLMQGRGKMQLVLVIVLSDVLFFLLENNHKYSFFTPDNKVIDNMLKESIQVSDYWILSSTLSCLNVRFHCPRTVSPDKSLNMFLVPCSKACLWTEFCVLHRYGGV